jgi:CheY-like chemotaxis protein
MILMRVSGEVAMGVSAVHSSPLEFVDLHEVASGIGLARTNCVSSTTVLIVEDDASVRDLMRTALGLAGFGTVTAPNGADALEYLRAGGDAGVILLDLMMPVMDGFEFRRQQLEEPPLAAIPVVVFSTMAGRRVPELDGCAAVDKLVDVSKVTEIIRQSVRAGPPFTVNDCLRRSI